MPSAINSSNRTTPSTLTRRFAPCRLSRSSGTPLKATAPQPPAGHAHMAGETGPVVAAIDDEIVAFRLAVDRLADRCFERLVAFRLPQRRTQVGGVLLPEAHKQRAGAGQPDAVAAFAEI